MKVDLAVIGGGPGGYTAAIKGAQLGGDVILVEEEKLGGVCVNVGCIPSKVLLNSTAILSQVRGADVFGVKVREASLDLNGLMARKKAVIDGLVEEIEALLKKHGVRLVSGRGRLTSPRTVEVEGQERRFKVESRAVIIAMGSRPTVPSIPGVEYAVTTAYLPEITEVPGRVVFIGGGPEGVEFGTVLRDMGAEVTVVEVLDTLLPLEDQDIGVLLEEILSASGVEVKVKTTVQSISESGGVKTVSIQGAAGEERLEADLVVVAMGRSPNSENLGLEDFSVAVEDGWIVVDEHMATNVKDVYAVGDVVGGGLAHVASAQGAVAAENALGSESIYDGRVVPRCIYTRPQVAAVGLTEKAARAQGHNLKIRRSDMNKNAKASVVGETKGFVKILADASNGRILGVHIIGENASEVISEASLAMRLDAKVGDIASTVHPYPTVSDALREAAQDAEDSSIYST